MTGTVWPVSPISSAASLRAARPAAAPRPAQLGPGAAAVLLLVCGAACTEATHPPRATAALVGREPVPIVRLFENHASALAAWRRAGIRQRTVVHLDGHLDLDWLPDETVAHLAAAGPGELEALERHPYAMDGETLNGFSDWNFLYAAARMGIVRRLVWVVPDGTLRDRAGAEALIRDLLREVQMVRVEEARSLRFVERRIQGEVLGLPILVCELHTLPELDGAVLLDVDLDYFTTRSAVTRYVTENPWTAVGPVVEGLAARAVRTDFVTVSMSTIGGGTPPGQRWLGRELQRHLRFPDRRRVGSSQRLEVARTAAEGRLDEAVEGYGRLTARRPGDASAWFGLAEALRAAGEPRRAGFAYHRAAELEPLLEHGDLFVADGLWLNGGYAPALDRYRSYLAARPASPFRAYALRRIGGCLMRLGRDEDAIDVFRQVVELAPDHADTRLDLGLLLRRGGRVAEALEQLQEARRILPHRGRYALALGTTYLMHGMPGRGARELEQAVRHQPCLARARANLSVALEQLGRPRDAARHLRLALALQPENPELVTLADQLEVRGVRLVRNP